MTIRMKSMISRDRRTKFRRTHAAIFLTAIAVTTTSLAGLDVHQAAPAAAACTAAPTYKPGKTQFGVSLDTTSLTYSQAAAKQDGLFGHVPVVRVFDGGAPPSNAWARRSTPLADRAIVTSFRMSPQKVIAGQYDTAMRQFFSTAPTDRAIFWSFIHEPEPLIRDGQFTFAQYRSAWQHLATLAASYCRSNLYPTMILTGWTTESASGRDWRDYYPGDAYTSVVAFDPYNSATGKATSYDSPSDLFDSTVAAAKASGKPWGIAETGSNKIPGDSSGSGRAAWLTKMGAYFKTNGASFVTYFQSTNNGDFELRDQPSINAWKALVGAS